MTRRPAFGQEVAGEDYSADRGAVAGLDDARAKIPPEIVAHRSA
jgi:hypothetical protein